MAKTKEQMRREHIAKEFKKAKENAEHIWSLLDDKTKEPVSIN